ncbi:hypothetical protein [Rhodobacteraceae bacterium DSL-40]|uniref:hypothetical protein n=1 Tax=Amaricoccus sp. B4 TaxID=3368557 RepID=UPI000DAB5F75
MAKISITITVDDAHLSATAAIAEVVHAQGFVIERVVPEAGAIRATGGEECLDRIRAIEGVLEAVPERGCSLPPMRRGIPQ